MHPSIDDIGSQISASSQILAIAATAAVNGAAVATESDWTNNNSAGQNFRFLSGVLLLGVLSPSGAPSYFSVAGKLQTSSNGVTGWQDLPNAAIQPITAPGQASVNVMLGASLGFVRAVVTPSFVGGTSPAIPIAATIILSGNNSN